MEEREAESGDSDSSSFSCSSSSSCCCSCSLTTFLNNLLDIIGSYKFDSRFQLSCVVKIFYASYRGRTGDGGAFREYILGKTVCRRFFQIIIIIIKKIKIYKNNIKFRKRSHLNFHRK